MMLPSIHRMFLFFTFPIFFFTTLVLVAEEPNPGRPSRMPMQRVIRRGFRCLTGRRFEVGRQVKTRTLVAWKMEPSALMAHGVICFM